MVTSSKFPPPPDAVKHTLDLSDGRKLAYYTFQEDDDDNEDRLQDSLHPVVYFHGFPGSGLEGAVCARQVAAAGGQLFAPDRPGFGYSDPYPEGLNEDERVQSFVDSIWELVRAKKWKSFSVIGVSGGGPFALELLTSYLNQKQEPPAKLEAVAHVAGICCSAGVEDVMPANQQLFELVSNCKTSWWSRTQLHLTFSIASLLTILPQRLFRNVVMLGMKKDLPEPDKDCFSNVEVSSYMINVLYSALRQGSSATELEVAVIFRPKQGFEEALKEHYQNGNASSFPRVSLYQGELDVNVPMKHAEYVRNELLGGKTELVRYPDLGHLSMVLEKASDYSQFVVPRK